LTGSLSGRESWGLGELACRCPPGVPDGYDVKKMPSGGEGEGSPLGINKIKRRLDNATTAKQDPPERSLSLFCSFQ